jgi:hypothetical protein
VDIANTSKNQYANGLALWLHEVGKRVDALLRHGRRFLQRAHEGLAEFCSRPTWAVGIMPPPMLNHTSSSRRRILSPESLESLLAVEGLCVSVAGGSARAGGGADDPASVASVSVSLPPSGTAMFSQIINKAVVYLSNADLSLEYQL